MTPFTLHCTALSLRPKPKLKESFSSSPPPPSSTSASTSTTTTTKFVSSLASGRKCRHCEQQVTSARRSQVRHSSEECFFACAYVRKNPRKRTAKKSMKKWKKRQERKLNAFNCRYCAKCFSRACDRNKHERRVHIKSHVCPVCQYRFGTRHDLGLHLKRASTCFAAAAATAAVVTGVSAKARLHCPDCSMKFDHRANLQRHRLASHPYHHHRNESSLDNRMRQYPCLKCCRMFSRKESLQKHKRVCC